MFVIYAMLAYFVVAMSSAAIILGRVRRRDRKREHSRPTKGVHARPHNPAARARLLHRGMLRGRTLRFYRSPLAGADFPWTALRDLFEAVTDGASYTVGAEWIYAGSPALAQAMVTETGPELLLSHSAGMELLSSLTPEPDRRASIALEFRELMAEAYVLQSAGLSREAFLELCALASRRPPDRHG